MEGTFGTKASNQLADDGDNGYQQGIDVDAGIEKGREFDLESGKDEEDGDEEKPDVVNQVFDVSVLVFVDELIDLDFVSFGEGFEIFEIMGNGREIEAIEVDSVEN